MQKENVESRPAQIEKTNLNQHDSATVNATLLVPIAWWVIMNIFAIFSMGK